MKRLIQVILLLAPLPQAHAALVPDPENAWRDVGTADTAALNNEANRLFTAGDYTRAASLLNQSLAQPQSQPDPSTLFNLAAVERLQSHLPEAADLYRRSIALRESISGPYAPELGHPLAGLALVYQTTGRASEALPLARRAVQLSAARPADWRQFADVRNTLTTLLLLHGDTAEAIALAGNVTRDLTASGNTATHEYVSALTNLGTASLRAGKLRDADTRLRQAEATAILVAGPRHRLTAAIWNNLAKVRIAQGDLAGAEPLYTRAIAVWRETLGPAHPDLATGLSNLAALYRTGKRYAEAERLYRQALAIDTAALGPDNLKVANDWGNLGALLALQRRRQLAAATNLEKALAIAEARVGMDHPDTATIAVNLAMVYCDQSQYARAAALLVRAVPVEERILDATSPELAAIRNLQASTLRRITLRNSGNSL